MGQRVVDRNQVRLDPLEQRPRAVRPLGFGHADQPDDIAQRIGLGDIGGAQAGDPAGIDRAEIDLRPERDRGEDRKLVRGIGAFDVEGRVGLGKAPGLGFGQHVGKIATGVLHGREDEVAGPVEDPVDPLDLVRGGAFAQPLDHRNPARHCRLELQRDLLLLGLGGEFEPVMGDHRLVGGDQRLAGLDRGARTGQRRAVRSADHLDHHVDIVALTQDHHVVFPGIGRQIDPAGLVAVARGNHGNPDRASGPAGDQLGIGFDQADHPDPHGTKSGKRNSERFGHVHPFRGTALRGRRRQGQAG